MRMQGTLKASEEDFVDYVLMLQTGVEVKLFWDQGDHGSRDIPNDVVLISKDDFCALSEIEDGEGSDVPIIVDVDESGMVWLESIEVEGESDAKINVEKTGAELWAEQVE